MLHLIGKGCIFCGVTLVGFLFAVQLNRRASCLREFSCGIECLERELGFALPLVDTLLERLERQAGRHTKDFYQQCRQRFAQRKQERFEEIWSECMEEVALSLQKEDRQILCQVGGIVGRYDSDSQRQGLLWIRTRLEEQYQQAKGQAERMGKVYGVLGASLAFFLVILL